MKTTLKLFFIVMLAMSALLSSCGKYEEGPKISLASKKSRLARAWQKQDCSSCATTEYKKDGTVSYGGVSSSGIKWQFSSDKKNLEIVSTISGASGTSNAEIMRLTSKDLWLKYTAGSVSTETHYVAK